MILKLLGYLILLLIILLVIYFFINVNKLDITTLNSIAKKVSKMEKLNSDDFKKKKEYFRDILNQYSPLLLSYIDNFELDFPRDIVGDIMALEIKKYIKMEDGIFINKENIAKNQQKLKNTDKYILQNIKNGILKINANEIKMIVQKEGVQESLLEEKVKEEKFNSGLLVILSVFFSMLFIILAITYVCGLRNLILVFVMAIFIVLFSILLILSCMVYSYKSSLLTYRNKNPFFRTEKGNEINKQLEGLKVFLQDYSNMKNRDAEMIAIWEDYLIYSVIFHQNNVALKKYLKYIKVD